MLCQSIPHDVHSFQLMARTSHGLALLPSRTIMLCVSVVVPRCGDAVRNRSWYGAEVCDTVQVEKQHYSFITSATFQSSAAKFWCGLYMCTEWAIVGSNSWARQSKVSNSPLTQNTLDHWLLHCILLHWRPKIYLWGNWKIGLLSSYITTVLEESYVTWHVLQLQE